MKWRNVGRWEKITLNPIYRNCQWTKACRRRQEIHKGRQVFVCVCARLHLSEYVCVRNIERMKQADYWTGKWGKVSAQKQSSPDSNKTKCRQVKKIL